jgi:hypothetical protein
MEEDGETILQPSGFSKGNAMSLREGADFDGVSSEGK